MLNFCVVKDLWDIHPPKSAVAAREIKMFFMMAINVIVVLIGLKGMNSTLALAVVCSCSRNECEKCRADLHYI